MTEPTLTTLRTRIEALASDGGAFAVVCGRTGERPVPVVGYRFETRRRAEFAARAAEQYRTALRRYDPALPRYDLIAVEGRTEPAGIDGTSPAATSVADAKR
ncbi:DUF7552 domain-containing protein [Halobellus captivus]|uniref:DUF7552 domain-containing protein n=1 Tax=Halobellus captivus TaxID=2592614 RepID=UPI00119D8348